MLLLGSLTTILGVMLIFTITTAVQSALAPWPPPPGEIPVDPHGYGMVFGTFFSIILAIPFLGCLIGLIACIRRWRRTS